MAHGATARCGRWSAARLPGQATQPGVRPGIASTCFAFQAFVWLTAVGERADPDDTVLRRRPGLRGPANWQPENFERPSTRGEITLDEALAHTVNTGVRPLLPRFRRAPTTSPHRRPLLGITKKLPARRTLAPPASWPEGGLLGAGRSLRSKKETVLMVFPGLTPFAVENPKTRPEPVIACTGTWLRMMAGMIGPPVRQPRQRAMPPRP